jgi:L-fuculose-phosphate aldolase
MVPTSTYRQFVRAGEDLFASGINNSHSGNMSIRLEDAIAITQTRSQGHRLLPDQIHRTSLHYRDAAAKLASTDLEIHRAIYRETPHRAVIHAHAPHAVVLSFSRDRIEPIDIEGKYYFDHIPVVDCDGEVGTPRLGALVAKTLRQHKILVIRGHGTVAAGSTLDECLHMTTMVESMARLMFLHSIEAQGGTR